MGCRRADRRQPDAAGVRHQRGDVDEPRRQPGRAADRLRPARRHLPDADRRFGDAGKTRDERSGVRHAAAVQPRRQAPRDSERPRRPLEHLDDRSRRRRREADLARQALVREQPDLVARRHLYLRSPSLRQGALARRRRSVDVPRRRRERRAAGDRARQLAEGRWRAGHLARRPASLLQQGRHTRAPTSNTTRIQTALSTRSSSAICSPAASAAPSASRADR